MPQNSFEASSLHVYNVESELWQSVTLATQVSRRSVEAMNLILEKDGILACIGTTLEFGDYCLKLERNMRMATSYCLHTLQASTIMSMLGLCQNMDVPGKPEMVFYGSPLTLALEHLLFLRDEGTLEAWLPLLLNSTQAQEYHVLDADGSLVRRAALFCNEYQDAWEYLNPNRKVWDSLHLYHHC